VRSDGRRRVLAGCGLAAALAAAALCTACKRESGREASMNDAAAVSFVERSRPPRDAGAGRPPLLVLLHGIGADENDLFPIAAMLDPRLQVVSLRAPHDYAIGYAWFDIAFSVGGIRPDLAQARQALGDLVTWLEAAPARLGTDPDRTYLLGFSQGAMMSLGVLGVAPGRLAGVIALSGRNAEGIFAAPADAAAIARVPLLVAHGVHDDLLPIDNGRAIRDAYQGTSADFTYREFPVGHGVSEAEIGVVDAWLREHLDRDERLDRATTRRDP
jgi:phospholipase/carboxylesterase